MTTVSIIIGSTREGRFGDKPGRWISSHLAKRQGVTAKLLDLRDFPLPFFDQAVPPAMPGRAPYTDEVVQRWTAAIAASDAFIVIAAEYNFGPPAVLKNAIDWVYPEWHRKPIGFVSYGSAGGTRSVQQLREIAVELQMAPIRSAVHLPRETLMAHFTGGDIPSALAKSDGDADRLLDDLLWWANALKAARSAAA
ncbi:NAD(P)H-dependent FMN reductase [Nannocystis exedens]|uniref:NAD(P)H-dependent FMN reductase n=1 Tax=Nannocystis exedens TaxID=54 RepID=A0A1I1UFS8_9BACT|nr:NAD(P)H-dependent oxidoreductase [Nannocystis exedens]PCC71542.1 nadph-dependent fmn reductase [Nannocystis exedens]SFD67623.1 NAD(P)H-dependent FMN reductase [Nannocystis exedens]